jgi:hypothetical protein
MILVGCDLHTRKQQVAAGPGPLVVVAPGLAQLQAMKTAGEMGVVGSQKGLVDIAWSRGSNAK